MSVSNGIAQFLSRHRRNRWIQWLDRRALAIHKGYENYQNYDVRTGGELSVLVKLSKVGAVKIVFDVGANRGDWTDLAMRTFSRAQIHAFEIVPAIFDDLKQRFHNANDVVLNAVGLSNVEENINIFVPHERDFLATCVRDFSEQFHDHRVSVVSGAVTTGDRYCVAKGIESIDYLKVDVEGLEPQVLRGFEAMLKRGKVEVIQFEYGYINIHTHFLLKDAYAYLAQFNMTIGKIYPDYVDFRPYKHFHEDFLGPNYLAVRAERQDLLRALGPR